MRWIHRIIALTVLIGLLCVPSTSLAARAHTGYLTFEPGDDGDKVGTSIPGIDFSSDAGGWLYGDVRTRQYNAPYGQSCADRPETIRSSSCTYKVAGHTFVWGGALGVTGRFAFTQGTATFVQAHISNGAGLTAIAYDAQDKPIAAQFLPSNAGTGRFGQLRLTAPTGRAIASVTLGGTANFWLLDDLATDAPGVPDQRSSHDRALVTVVVQPNSATPAADGTLTYTIVTSNRGRARASDTTITIPFDAQKVAVISAVTSRPTAWVSKVLSDSLELRSGSLGSVSDTVTTTLRLAMLPGATADANLLERLSFTWRDASGGGSSQSNQLATDRMDSAGNYKLDVATPKAPASVSRTFSSAIFAPGEPVSIWYNRPDGSVAAVSIMRADDNGVVQLDQSFAGQPAGDYSMVFCGWWTKFTAAGGFQIEAAPAS